MSPDLIYDIGMNNGDDTAFYLREGFRVLAVEASPTLARAAASRFEAEIAAGRLTVLNVGISAEEKVLPFWVCEKNSEWSSFHRAVASRDGAPHHAIEVPCRRFRSILAEFGVPYYLKVDIEGNDSLCLEDLDAADVPTYVSVEAGDVSVLEVLKARGFTHFKCISQYNLLPVQMPPSDEQVFFERILRWLYSNSPPVRVLRGLGLKRALLARLNRSRQLRGWTFPFGSSGAFGEDLPGRWQGFEEMSETYRTFQALSRSGAPSVFWDARDYSFWTDFHARSGG